MRLKVLRECLLTVAFVAGSVTTTTTHADSRAEASNFDYFSENREYIRNGVQAVLMCNGLFTSQRPLEAVFDQELAYLKDPVGGVSGGNYQVSENQKAVTVGGDDDGIAITAAFRPGIGCVVMSPDQALSNIPELPQNQFAAKTQNVDEVSWPMGDSVPEYDFSSGDVDPQKLQMASDWAFDRESSEQTTISLIVVHKGQIVHERYAPGFDYKTKTRTWSTAKSIAASIIGLLVDEGRLELDGPLLLDWLPEMKTDQDDPRDQISLRHVLNMSSGLYPVDSYGMEYATGSGLSYWAGASSSIGARKRGLVRQPGSYWDYENYDTLLAVLAMKRELGDDYHFFGYRELLHKLGMFNTLMSTDRFGDYILSSQVYTNARDLARFGMLYQQRGVWQGKKLISEDWIRFSTTPAPASKVRNNDYGGQWWLVPDNRKDVPANAYSTAGNRGQYVIVVPDQELVIVRRGLDFGKQGFNRWDLTREILKSINK